MAKRTSKVKDKAMETTAVETVTEAIGEEAQFKQFAVELRVEFYNTFKRQTTLDVDAMVALVKANATEQQMAAEWWYAKIQEAEKAKGIATPRVESTNAIVDLLSQDTELTEVTLQAAAAGDLPPRAPAHIAFMLVRDHAKEFNGDTRKARAHIVRSYAQPNSKMDKFVDGWGNTIGENERTDYFWDYADRGAGMVSWYAERLVDCLPSGKAINSMRTALRERQDKIINIDGVDVNPATMAPSQRTKATEQMDNRRSRLITAHRDAVSVIMQWHDIETRLGVKRNDEGDIIRDDKGNAVDVGRVTVDWAWLDDAQQSMGLSPTKSIIVVRNILQDGERKGELGSAFYPYTAAQFINLSVDQAIAIAAKAGRGMDKLSIIDLTASKRERKQAVSAGSKLAKAKRAAEEAAKVSAERIPDWFAKMYDWQVTDGNWSALRAKISHMKQQDMRAFLFHVVKVVEGIDKNLVTPAAQKIAAEVETERTLDEQKEIDAKAQQQPENKSA